MQASIDSYTKKITNELGATTLRTFYSVYDANHKLVLHTSNKSLALRTLEQLNNNTSNTA